MEPSVLADETENTINYVRYIIGSVDSLFEFVAPMRSCTDVQREAIQFSTRPGKRVGYQYECFKEAISAREESQEAWINKAYAIYQNEFSKAASRKQTIQFGQIRTYWRTIVRIMQVMEDAERQRWGSSEEVMMPFSFSVQRFQEAMATLKWTGSKVAVAFTWFSRISQIRDLAAIVAEGLVSSFEPGGLEAKLKVKPPRKKADYAPDFVAREIENGLQSTSYWRRMRMIPIRDTWLGIRAGNRLKATQISIVNHSSAGAGYAVIRMPRQKISKRNEAVDKPVPLMDHRGHDLTEVYQEAAILLQKRGKSMFMPPKNARKCYMRTIREFGPMGITPDNCHVAYQGFLALLECEPDAGAPLINSAWFNKTIRAVAFLAKWHNRQGNVPHIEWPLDRLTGHSARAWLILLLQQLGHAKDHAINMAMGWASAGSARMASEYNQNHIGEENKVKYDVVQALGIYPRDAILGMGDAWHSVGPGHMEKPRPVLLPVDEFYRTRLIHPRNATHAMDRFGDKGEPCFAIARKTSLAAQHKRWRLNRRRRSVEMKTKAVFDAMESESCSNIQLLSVRVSALRTYARQENISIDAGLGAIGPPRPVPKGMFGLESKSALRTVRLFLREISWKIPIAEAMNILDLRSPEGARTIMALQEVAKMTDENNSEATFG